MMIPKRSIALSIIFSFITCGIYGIYWFISLTNELNNASKSNATSGGMAFFLTLITCGFYGWYWAFKQGEKVDKMNGTSSSTGVVYLLFQIFGLGIVGYSLMQNELNKYSDGQTTI